MCAWNDLINLTKTEHKLCDKHSLHVRTSGAGSQKKCTGTPRLGGSNRVGTQGNTSHHDKEGTSGKEEGYDEAVSLRRAAHI